MELWLQWLGADARRRAVFVRLESSWRQTEALKWLQPVDGTVSLDVLDTFPGLRPHALPQPPVTRPTRPHWWQRQWDPLSVAGRQAAYRTLAVALTAGMLTSVVILGSWLSAMVPDRATYRTERGEFERIVLPDGSTEPRGMRHRSIQRARPTPRTSGHPTSRAGSPGHTARSGSKRPHSRTPSPSSIGTTAGNSFSPIRRSLHCASAARSWPPTPQPASPHSSASLASTPAPRHSRLS
jgi:hypothetical protein